MGLRRTGTDPASGVGTSGAPRLLGARHLLRWLGNCSCCHNRSRRGDAKDPCHGPGSAEQWGMDPDDVRWEEEAINVAHESLASVRTTAKSWGETITALLGVFSAVAFIKGPDAFTAIDGDGASVAALLIIFAAGLAAVAIALAAFAAQGVPRAVAPLDGWALSHWYVNARRCDARAGVVSPARGRRSTGRCLCRRTYVAHGARPGRWQWEFAPVWACRTTWRRTGPLRHAQLT